MSTALPTAVYICSGLCLLCRSWLLLTDSLNLYGPAGIYTNYEEPWEKYCRINYFVNGNLDAEANAGLRIQGASSTFMPKKGFRFFFRGDYGTSGI